jgi:hypothetical protein
LSLVNQNFDARKIGSIFRVKTLNHPADLDHGVSSAPPAAIRAIGHDPGHELASIPSAAICAITGDLRGHSQENETK